MVVCECDCGNYKTTAARNLTRGQGLHCGCVKPTPKHKPEMPQLISKVKATYKENAKKRQQEFELADTEFEHLISAPCYYCGSAPSNVKELRGVTLYWNGIDRKDNSIGYVRTNVVTCCTDCNYLKCERNHDEFVHKVKLISENLSKNNLTAT